MNKLKYFAAALLLFAVSFVGGCAGMDMHTKAAEARTEETPERMRCVERSLDFYIYRDNKTGVNYLLYDKALGYGRGSVMCVLVDADGKPLVSEV